MHIIKKLRTQLLWTGCGRNLTAHFSWWRTQDYGVQHHRTGGSVSLEHSLIQYISDGYVSLLNLTYKGGVLPISEGRSSLSRASSELLSALITHHPTIFSHSSRVNSTSVSAGWARSASARPRRSIADLTCDRICDIWYPSKYYLLYKTGTARGEEKLLGP